VTSNTESQIQYKKLYSLIEQIVTQNTYEHLMIKQYLRATKQIHLAHCSFYFLTNRNTYQVEIKNLALSGDFHVTFHLANLGIYIDCDKITDTQSITRITDTSIQLQFAQGYIVLEKGMKVSIDIHVNVSDNIPSSFDITFPEKCLTNI
jgi:hypothetical protein